MGHLANRRICFVLFRCVLPLLLLAATIVRFNVFSLIYGCLTLIAPLLSHPSPVSLRGHTGRFLTACLVITSLTVLSQSIFQLTLVVISARDYDIDSILGNCSGLETVLRQIGLQRVDGTDAVHVIQTILPDVIAFAVCLTVFVCCRTLPLTRVRSSGQLQRHSVLSSASIRGRPLFPSNFAVHDAVGNFVTIVIVAACGIIQPSLLSAVYFVTVLVVVTLWAAHVGSRTGGGHAFQRLRLALLVYTVMYLLLIYVGQFHFAHRHLWVADHLVEGAVIERLLGLSHFVSFNCSQPWKVSLETDLPWTAYTNVAVLILLYFVLAIEIRRWRDKRVAADRACKMSPSISERKHRSARLHLVIEMDASLLEKPSPGNEKRFSSGDSAEAGSMVPDSPVYGTASEHSGVPSVLKERSIIHSVSTYLMEQSYIGMLIVMMIWSITYHSWLTFVFLLAACFLWIMPQKKSRCLRCSPIVVFYAECLLVLQYIYGFNLSSSELPTSVHGTGYRLDEIGIAKYDYPALHLAIKLVFTYIFWLTLRQFSLERRFKKITKSSDMRLERIDTQRGKTRATIMNAWSGEYDGEIIKDAGRWLWHFLIKYWLFVCAALFLVIALKEPVIFHIIYMLLFLSFVLIFKISYYFWRLCTKAFLWLVIIYSMIMLVCIYTFQFDDINHLWHNKTGLSTTHLANIGLRKFTTASLFIELLSPASFLMVIIIQLHYFHKDFLLISKLDRDNTDGSVAVSNDDVGPAVRPQIILRHSWKQRIFLWILHLWRRVNLILDNLSVVLWRIAEVHVFKLVVFAIFFSCINEVSAMNIIAVIFVILTMPFSKLHSAMSILCYIWASLVILIKMTYHLKLIPGDILQTNCSRSYNFTSSRYKVHSNSSWGTGDLDNVTTESYDLTDKNLNTEKTWIVAGYANTTLIDNADYVGFVKSQNMAKYLLAYIIVVLVLAFESIIKYHQIQFHNLSKTKPPPTGVIFRTVTRKEADDGLLNCIKFFVNYGFYRFGREVCLTMTMVTMVVRLDVYSLLYGLFLGVLLLLSRRQCYSIWPVYMMILMAVLLVQYCFCLGLPPSICWDYPWTKLVKNLKTYLYLPHDFPDYIYSPAPKKLIADFFQLLFVCLQWHVFRLEASGGAERCDGGSNKCIIKDIEGGTKNPYDDFLSYKRSYLDYIKAAVFFYSFWITLMIVLITGTARISLFCMGYILCCFIFLWLGEDMLLNPICKLVRMWMGLLIYCYLVIMAKCLLQLIGCVFMTDTIKSHCWLMQLFNIICLHSDNYHFSNTVRTDKVVQSSLEDEAGLLWDAICFVFLLMMIRICKSWYFQHVVTELRLNKEFAYIGASLINTNLLQRVEKQRQEEQRIVDRIRQKMDRIKNRHRREREKEFVHEYTEPTDHYEVIRSGDKYMFDELSEDEMDAPAADTDVDGHVDSNVDYVRSQPDWREERIVVGPMQLINAAIIGGPKEALNLYGGRATVFSPRPRRSVSGSSAAEFSTPEPTSIQAASPANRGSPLHMVQDVSTVDGNPTSDLVLGCSPPDRASPVELEHTIGPIVGQSPTESTGSGAFVDAVLSVSQQLSAIGSPCQSPDLASLTIESVSAVIESPTPLPSDLPASADGQRQQNNVRPRTGDKPSPRRMATTAVTTDSLPAVVEEDSIDEPVFVMARDDTDVFSADDVMPGVAMPGDDDDETGTDTYCGPLVNGVKVGYAFGTTVLDWCMAQLFKVSQQYRCVSGALERQKTNRKLKTRKGSDKLLSYSVSSSRAPDDSCPPWTREEEFIQQKKTAEKSFHTQMPRILKLFIAFGEALVSQSDILCYFAMVLNTLMSGSVLSLLFPVSIFFWAMLNVPRPKKYYWITIITYTETVIAVKYLFQFICFPWNQNELQHLDPWWWPRLLGIERKDMYAAYDFFLLFCLFLHRMLLKSHGLWNDAPSNAVVSSSQHLSLNINETNDVEDKANPAENSEGPSLFKRVCSKLMKPVKKFFCNMINPKYSASIDVYALMFFCDLITFLIVVFGYASFGPSASGGTDVATVIKQNRVPVPFLSMLLVQFVLIIVDRALYLRKQVIGKFIFHIFLVILVHIWMFFVLPGVTDRAFTENVAAQLWYFTKCIYFVLSCYQIRSGFPTRIIGNVLTKNYNYVNLVLFKGFLAVPFLLELRALMDWMWTDTTLGITSWLQMEDIYANIFVLKCGRWAEKALPTPRGMPRRALTKYGLGGLILFLLIFVIWFPLLLFSLSSSIYTPAAPISVSVRIKIGGFEPIFSVSSQDELIQQIKPDEYRYLKNIYAENPRGMAYLNVYSEEDIYRIRVFGSSASIWEISKPSMKQLCDDLHKKKGKIAITFTVSFSREPQDGLTETVSQTFQRVLDHEDYSDGNVMESLADIINGSYNNSVIITNLFPRYMAVPGKGKVAKSTALYSKGLEHTAVKLTLHYDKVHLTKYWQVDEIVNEQHEFPPSDEDLVNRYEFPSPIGKLNVSRYLYIVSFNERVPTGVLSVFDKYGIIGLYLSLVLVVGKFVRLWTQGLTTRIIIDEMPCPERIYELCCQIFLSRATENWELEEELFAKLIFIFRSPEMLFEISRRRNYSQSYFHVTSPLGLVSESRDTYFTADAGRDDKKNK